MADHILRPAYWAEEFILLVPRFQAGDVVHVMFSEQVQALQTYANTNSIPITVVEMVHSGQCQNCGVDAYGYFCGTCARGHLHRQTCPQLIDRTGSRRSFSALHELGILPVNPDAPCNCGAFELETAIRHATDGVRM